VGASIHSIAVMQDYRKVTILGGTNCQMRLTELSLHETEAAMHHRQTRPGEEQMKVMLPADSLRRAKPGPRRSRRQHLSNLLLILLGGLTVFNVRSFWYGIDFAFEGYTDFSQFYAGAMSIRDGLGEDLYTYEVQENIQKQLYSTAENRTGPLVSPHPAFEILIFLPLTYTSYARAYIGWVLLNLTILLAVPLLLFPFLGNLRPVFGINVFVSLFAFFPIFNAVYHGQDSLVLLLLFVSAFVSLKRGRTFLAGALLGFGLFRFHIVVPFMLLFVVRRQWKVLRGFAVTAIFVTGVSLFVTGWQGAIRYISLLSEINRNLTDKAHQLRFALYPTAMTNLRGLAYTLFAGQVSDTVITTISLLFSLLVLLWFFFYLKNRVSDAEDHDLDFSIGIVVMLLVGLYVHLYDWALLMLPILLLSNRLAGLSRPRGLDLWTLRFTVVLLLMTPVYVGLILLEFTSVLFIPLLVFGGLIVAATSVRLGSEPTSAGAEA
jgi:Glycosyltransferase family 87